MSLSQRTILLIVSTFIALLFILVVTSDVILLSSYSALEKRSIATHARQVLNQMNDKLAQLDLAARDVAERMRQASGSSQSPDTHRSYFLLDDQYLRTQRIDLAAVFSADGTLLTVRGFDCDKDVACAVSTVHQQALTALVARATASQTNRSPAVLNLDGTALMVAIQPIIATQGGLRGNVVVGWFIDRVEMERLFRATGSSVEVYAVDTPPATALLSAADSVLQAGEILTAVIGDDSVGGYFQLADLFAQPTFIVHVVEKRIMYQQGRVTIAYIITALVLACGIVCGVMLIFIRGTILQRLGALSDRVIGLTTQHDLSARLPLSHHRDELHSLAVSINGMLEALEAAEVQKRESEARYRLLFERAPDAIIVVGMEGDEAGRIISANQAAADQHGYTLEELCRLRIYDLNTADTNKIAPAIFERVSSGEWVQAEIWHQKKDGTQFPIEIHAGLITVDGRSYTLGFDRDITQRKVSEESDHMYLEQIRQLNAELSRQAFDLAAANGELEAFNFSVSHDMRGPLTRISGYCQLLLEDAEGLDADRKAYISRIYESGVWLNEMIDAMLMLSRLTRAEFVTEQVNLSRIADDIIRELALSEPTRKPQTRITPDVMVAGDQRLLRILMTNLLNNAWKYSTGTAQALIEFGIARLEPVPVYFVRDNGVGFDMQEYGKLFRVFTRLHDQEQFSGTGIGLATVQRIIFRHGGRVWAEAAVGQGATFFFTLQTESVPVTMPFFDP